MTQQKVSRPSDDGVHVLGQLLGDARDRAGFTDWGDFAAWLSEITGVKITKDVVYKMHVGNYRIQPSFICLYAVIIRVPDRTGNHIMRFRDEENTPVTMNDVGDILYGLKTITGAAKKVNGVV